MEQQQARARITRGGSTISSYDSDGKALKQEIRSEHKSEKINFVPIYHRDDDMVGKIKVIYNNTNVIPFHTLAACIVGEIRRIYFESINRPDSYDIQILTYMDKILFNNLTDIIEGIIHYGSGCFPKDMVQQIITDVITIMEAQPNMKAIFHIIDRLYEEF